MKTHRVSMIEQDPMQRITNFQEVNLGLTTEMAVAEAKDVSNAKSQNVLKDALS